MPPRHLAHDARIPPRRFDYDIARLLGDHRVVAAHHAGETDGLFRVANDEVFGSELALDSVESLQRLAGARLANDDLPAFEKIHVENMRGLPDFPEDVVGGV